MYPYNLGAIYPTWSVTTSLPATSTNRRSQAKEVVVKLDSCYPHLEICECLSPPSLIFCLKLPFSDPAVYPDNVKNIYPQITASELATKELAVTSNTDEILANTSLQSIAVSLTTCYPVFDICKCRTLSSFLSALTRFRSLCLPL